MNAIRKERIILLAIGVFLMTFAASGQFIAQEMKVDSCHLPFHQRPVIEIQEVAIGDTFLLTEIKSLIHYEVQHDSLFRTGLGYLILDFCDVRDNEALRCYYITPRLASLKEEHLFPPFYTYVEGRLVFIFSSYNFPQALCYRFSEKSKRKLRKKLEPFLEKTQDVTAYTMDGKVAFRDKKFRMDRLMLHRGRTIYVYSDKPPKVVWGSSEVSLPEPTPR